MSIKPILAIALICLSASLPAKAEPGPESYDTGALSEQRVDIQNVVMALVYNLQGVKAQGIGAVMLDENFGRLADGTGLRYTEFRLASVVITEDFAPLDDERYRKLSMVLELTDPGWRTAFLSVSTTYYLDKELIFVEQAEVAPIYVGLDRIKSYYLPTQGLPTMDEMQQMAYPQLAELIAANALMPEQLADLNGGELKQLRLIAINHSRQQADSQLMLKLGGQGQASQAMATAQASWNLNGWPVAALQGAFIFNTAPGFTFVVSQRKDGADEEPVAAIASLFNKVNPS